MSCAACPAGDPARVGTDVKIFIGELRRRNVIRMAGLYLVGAWLLVQVASTVLPLFGAPEWIVRSVVVLLALGFLPALLFAWVYEITPEGLKRESEIDRRQSITPQTGRRMEHATVVLLALALAYFAFDKFMLAPRREAALVASTQQAARSATAAAPQPSARSIAVLPLANAGGKDQQFFADGLSEALIIALSQFDGLKVIGRNSAFQFRDSHEGSRAIGTKLGVRHLLEGSVQHAGDAVRVSLELIDASSGQTLWSQRFDRPYKDLFKLQDEITTAVAGALRTKLMADQVAPQDDRPPSGRLDAYDAYLLGKFYVARNTEADTRTAIAHLTRATQLDPGYGMAYAELAREWNSLATGFAQGAEVEQAYARAAAAVARAVALAPDQAYVHVMRSRLLASRQDWKGSEIEARRAAELAPNSGIVLFALGQARARDGQTAQAIALTRQALATDPLNSRWYGWLGGYLLAHGPLDEAQQAIDKSLELQPDSVSDHYNRALLAVLRGDAAGALAAAKACPPGGWQDLSLTTAMQIGVDRAAADAQLQAYTEKYANEWAFQIAELHALRNEPDAAFRWLERARVQKDPGLEGLLTSALLLRYRDDPRFAAFVRKVGLAPISAQ
jgi:TolB-like protein/Tfp pilus assembly protein PilF